MTPTPTRHVSISERARTPGPPQPPPRPRRLSHESPPRLAARTLSEEKHDAHQRWLPQAYAFDRDREEALAKKFSVTRSPSRASQQYTYRYRVEEEED